VVFYILIIAVLNMGLGFAVAVFLASRGEPRTAAILPDAGPKEFGQEPPSAADPLRELSPGEESVEMLHGTVERYNRQLAEVDDRLRECGDSGDATGMKTCLDSLHVANQEYLVAREEAHEAFLRLYREQREFESLCGRLEKATDEQVAQIRQTNVAIEQMDCGADVAEGCRQMIGEASKLLETSHQVRDVVVEAVVCVARSEDRVGSLDEPECRDALTGLASRAGLEKELEAWWAGDPHRSKPLCVVMVDLDQFGHVNEQFGTKAGDRVLRAVGQLMAAEARDRATAARLCGQRFLLLFTDCDARLATNVAERVRQKIDVSHLRCGPSEIRVTVSCGVAPSEKEDTLATLLARAAATLKEAKRYGRNRTFAHDSGYPAPVVPPNLSLEENFLAV